MSRLISLYKSLSDDQIKILRKDVMPSEGVAYLNSKDEGFLLRLACIERIEELDRAAVAVIRLGKKCSDPGLDRFDNVYSDLKLGFINLGKLDLVSKEIEKNMEKMEGLISATSGLYVGLEMLSEMDVVERKQIRLKNRDASTTLQKASFDILDYKIALQRQYVHHLRDISLWGQTFDKVVGLMARTICTVFARICVVFGPYIPILPSVLSTPTRHMRFSSLQIHFNFNNPPSPRVRPVAMSKSGPLPKSPMKHGLVRLWSRDSKTLSPLHGENTRFGAGFCIGIEDNHYFRTTMGLKLLQQACKSTVGGSGLTLRYANVIILTEKYFNSTSTITDYDRCDLYDMLTASLKMSVKSKLRNLLKNEEEWSSMSDNDELLAEGWRDGVSVIMSWLGPMADNTVRWLSERNFEKQNFDVKPSVLLLQTLFFADKEKTEAAIAEVLVGLSCICRFEIQRSLFRDDL
ncbi:hypothetical protein GIB67_012249 [Kingdonia uniflora]|uniref:Uncharacterized protein n=1 Tax=Kingdonia uniflora TaxID=39325 RepID=A0A7J7M928_9MAGN|nr:hypothetical protein GIB67_012249 [Kingdonia uniflora]